jgi:predicted PurR-regulated permease PerM
MALTNKDIKRIFVASLLIILAIVSFLIIKPILLSIISGLLLAYIFSPTYKKFYKLFKEGNTTAFAVCILIFLIIIVPLWFLLPTIINQTFELFNIAQNIDFVNLVSKIFPNSTPKFQRDTASIIVGFIGKITSTSLDSLLAIVTNLPTTLLHLAVIIFVFFFSLRDQKELKEFISGISPFKKEKEIVLVKRFKEITSSLIFGYVIIGIIQGIVLGIGLILFGFPRAITLTFISIFASILPMIGPWLVWIPVTIIMISQGDYNLAIGFALYSGILVSSIDNFLRSYIIAKKTGTSSVIVLIGMIGGLFVFGILGLIIGPLVLSYLILFLRAYKDKTLSDMFSPE